MLTATYTLVALSVEQASVRLSLQAFQKHVRATLQQQNSLTLSQLEYACETLNNIYQACHWRKTEMYLIPAIREATERADQLLDELSRLNQAALMSIRLLQGKLGALADVRDEQVSEVCDSMETFCTSLLKKLEKEEQELFALARAAIGGETWFSIANQLMMHDKHVEELMRAGLTPADAAQATAKCSPAPRSSRVGDERQISIPGLSVLPTLNLEDEPAPVVPRSSTRQQAHDDVITK